MCTTSHERRLVEKLTISVIIPAKNEEDSIGIVVSETRRVLGENAEIIVVDGHSVDNTVKAALEADRKTIVIRQIGRGKGAGLKTAFKHSTGATIVIIDADFTYDPVEMLTLVKPIISGEADFVLGSRFMGEMQKGAMTPIHSLANKMISLLVSLFCRKRITDVLSGFRAMKRSIIDSISFESDGFDIETEMTMKIVKRRFRTLEVPIKYRRRLGKSKLSNLRDGVTIFKRVLLP